MTKADIVATEKLIEKVKNRMTSKINNDYKYKKDLSYEYPDPYFLTLRNNHVIKIDFPYYLYANTKCDDTENQWFRLCEKNNIPYIVIRKKQKNYSVIYDGMSYNSQTQEIIRNNNSYYKDAIEEIIFSLLNFDPKILSKWTYWNLNTGFFRLDKLSWIQSEVIAQNIFCLFYDSIHFYKEDESILNLEDL